SEIATRGFSTKDIFDAGLPKPSSTRTSKKPNRGFLNTGISNPFDLAKPENWGIAGSIKTGAALLDLLARGNYATANVFTNASSQDKDTSFDFLKPPSDREPDKGRTSVGEDISAFWEGLTGRTKNTFGDALREE